MAELKLRRRDRRVLLVLLTDAADLSGWPIARTAQVRAGSVYPLLIRLEQAGHLTSEWQQRTDGRPRRRLYRLTPSGREWALHELGLEPRPGLRLRLPGTAEGAW